MYTEWEIAIALNRKCCSSRVRIFGFCVGKCHDFNQHLLHTQTQTLDISTLLLCVQSMRMCMCVVQRCCCRRRRCCCFCTKNRSFKCVFTCIVGRLLCLRLFDVSRNWRSECAGIFKRHSI